MLSLGELTLRHLPQPVNSAQLHWADLVVCFEKAHATQLQSITTAGLPPLRLFEIADPTDSNDYQVTFLSLKKAMDSLYKELFSSALDAPDLKGE